MKTHLFVFLFGFFFYVSCQPIGQNLDFEQTTCDPYGWTCYLADNSGYIPGWSFVGSWSFLSTGYCPPSGSFAVILSGSEESIQQNLATTAGALYEISWRSQSPWYDNQILTVTIGSNVTDFTFPTTSPYCEWATTTLTFRPTSNSTLLKFSAAYIGVDNIQITMLEDEFECSSDAGCFGNGLCTNAQNSTTDRRICSCFPGYSQTHCLIPPASECSSQISPVNALAMGFQSTASIDYLFPNLTIAFHTNLEEGPTVFGTGEKNTPPYSLHTIAYFGSDRTAFPNCSYPNNVQWAKRVNSACQDEFSLTLSWAEARDSCGFSAIPGTKTYTQTLTVERYYQVNARGLQRVERHVRNLTVDFPEEISLSIIQPTVLSGVPNFEAAVTMLEFNPATDLWTAVVSTTLQSPYVILNQNVATVSGLLASANRFSGSQLNTVAGCSSSGLTCFQEIVFQFAQGSAPASCSGLTGSLLTSIVIGCDNSVAAGLCNVFPVANITLPFDTTDSCPYTDYINLTGSLEAYEDADLTESASSFFFNEVAYFGVHLESNQAHISSSNIKSGSLCFKLPNGTCVYPHYTELPAVNGFDPVFSVAFADPQNAGLFNSLATTDYQIKATVSVNFQGAKGMKKTKATSQKIDLSFEATIKPASNVGGVQASSSVALTCGWMLALLCLISSF